MTLGNCTHSTHAVRPFYKQVTLLYTTGVTFMAFSAKFLFYETAFPSQTLVNVGF